MTAPEPTRQQRRISASGLTVPIVFSDESLWGS
jgi:hypothetical protein